MELSAHAVDNDVHTPAAGQAHHAVSQALAREVDDVLIAAGTRRLRFRAGAGGRDRERCAEFARNLHALHTHGATYGGSKYALPGAEGDKLRQHEIPRQVARAGEEGGSVIVVDMRGDWHQARGGCGDQFSPSAVGDNAEAGPGNEHAVADFEAGTLGLHHDARPDLTANPRQILRCGGIMVAGAKGIIQRIDPDRVHPHQYLTVVRSRCRKINEFVLRIVAVGAILDGFHR